MLLIILGEFMKNKVVLVFFFMIGCIFLSSCYQNRALIVQLQPTPDLGLGTEWALVTDPYAIFRSTHEITATASAHGRRGDVLQVIGKKIISDGKKQTYWYEFQEGWLSETSVKIYSNQLKAITAASEL